MSDEEKITTSEGQEQIKPIVEIPKSLEKVIEIQGAEVAGDVKSVKEAGGKDVSKIEVNGLPKDAKEVKEVIKKTSEEAEDAKEEYEEQLKNIPNAKDLTESFKTKENIKESIVEVKKPLRTTKIKTRIAKDTENKKACPKCGALFSGTANFCGKCGTRFGGTKTGVELREEKEREKSPAEVNFYNENDEKCNIPEEHRPVIDKVINTVDQENKHYSKFFDGKNVTDTIEIKKSEDNFFAPDIERRIDVPFKNPETIEETTPILRHEAFHRAMRMDEDLREPRDEIYDNIKNGKDTEIEFIGNIKTAQFQKFIGDEEGKGSILNAAEINLGKTVSDTHLERNMEELIEESLADEAMLKREKETDPENAISRVIKAKITALDNIAKNKGLKDYKELDPLQLAGFRGFLANYYNTFKFLSKISSENGDEKLAGEFNELANNAMKKMEDKTSESFKRETLAKLLEDDYGYNQESLIKEIKDLAGKFQDLTEED